MGKKQITRDKESVKEQLQEKKRWWKNPSWWLAIFSLFGLYGAISSEFGPFGKYSKIQFFPENSMKISHNYGMLRIDLPMDFIKTGRGAKSIFKVKACIVRRDKKFLRKFKWNKTPLTFYDNFNSRLNIQFIQDIDMDHFKNIAEKLLSLNDEIAEKFKETRKLDEAYFADSGVTNTNVTNLKNFAEKFIKPFVASDYYIIIVVWEHPNDKKPMELIAYSFTITKYQETLLHRKELENYDSLIEFNPKLQKVRVTCFLDKMPEEETYKLYKEYKEHLKLTHS